jgi:hypothetical protein
LGTYTPFGLAPVGAAAVSGILIAKAFGASGSFMNQMAMASALSRTDFALLLLLGLICALFGVRIMRAVTEVEGLCARAPIARANTRDRWAHRRASRADYTSCAVFWPWRSIRAFDQPLAPSDVVLITLFAEGRRIGNFAWHWLSRRALLCVAFPRRHAWPGLLLRSRIYQRAASAGCLCLHTGRNGRACRCDHRRADGNEFSGAGDDRQFSARSCDASRCKHCVDYCTAHFRLFFCHLAAACARRVDPQRARCRLDARLDGRTAHANRRAKGTA